MTAVCFHHSVKDSHGSKSYWLCKCDCGKEVVVRTDLLTSGNTKSCGCLHRELSAARGDGRSREKLYRIYWGMKTRCEDTKSQYYYLYGGRGIKICDEWQDYTKFREWAISSGYDPKSNRTIDRIDNNGNYEPSNCRWATPKQQARNRRTNVWLEYDGKRMCIKDWAKELGVHETTFRAWILRQNHTIEWVINKKCIDYPTGSTSAIDTQVEAEHKPKR